MANIAPNITSVGISCEPPPPTPPGEGAIAHATSGKKRLIGPSGYPIVREKPSPERVERAAADRLDRKSTRLNSSHITISYAVFCLKKKKKKRKKNDNKKKKKKLKKKHK